uniref:Neurensin-1-like n=1 Tax=Petromyzon marinus TaxID=7757 RepID=A0AAJ7TC99_PETMA|nr:neurensin-1-like [Petromyzon marinus]XP_032815201.1 neurensin-1-like [Petromyzon marinus]
MACQDCGFRRGATTPFGVRSYLDHFYQGCRSEPDEETLLRPGGRRGAQAAAGASTACKAWFACGLLGMLTGAAVMLTAYLAPARLEAVGNGGGGGPGGVSDVLLVDPSAARFNRILEGSKLAGALLFAAGGAALSGSLLVAAAAARGRGGGDDDGGEVMTAEHQQQYHQQQEDEEVVQENRLLLHEVRPVASGAVPKSGRRLWK